MFRGQEASTGKLRSNAGGIWLPGRPDVANARAYWEQDQWDQGLARNPEDHRMRDRPGRQGVAEIEEWCRKHPVQTLGICTGLKKPPADLQRLEQTHAESIRFVEGSQRRLAELEQASPKKRLVYHQQLEREGEEIIKAKRLLGVS